MLCCAGGCKLVQLQSLTAVQSSVLPTQLKLVLRSNSPPPRTRLELKQISSNFEIFSELLKTICEVCFQRNLLVTISLLFIHSIIKSMVKLLQFEPQINFKKGPLKQLITWQLFTAHLDNINKIDLSTHLMFPQE